MESYHYGLLGFVVLLILIALRVPIAFALTLVGLGGLFLLAGQDATFAMLSTQLYSSVANNTLTAVPLFASEPLLMVPIFTPAKASPSTGSEKPKSLTSNV